MYIGVTLEYASNFPIKSPETRMEDMHCDITIRKFFNG